MSDILEMIIKNNNNIKSEPYPPFKVDKLNFDLATA